MMLKVVLVMLIIDISRENEFKGQTQLANICLKKNIFFINQPQELTELLMCGLHWFLRVWL